MAIKDEREDPEDEREAQDDDLHRVRDEGEEDHDEEGLKRRRGSGRTAGAFSPLFGPPCSASTPAYTHA